MPKYLGTKECDSLINKYRQKSDNGSKNYRKYYL